MKNRLFSLIFFFYSLSAFGAQETPIKMSMMVVNLSHPQVLAANNADLQLTPASTSKLFVAATALRQLGNDYRFTTQLYTRGSIKNGILRGDLILYGMGDPMLNNEALWQLSVNLKQLGITEIKGNLIINKSYLGKVLIHSTDQIQAQTFTDNGYASQLSSSGSDFGVVGIGVFPVISKNENPRVAITPFDMTNIQLAGYVNYSETEASAPIKLTRRTIADKE